MTRTLALAALCTTLPLAALAQTEGPFTLPDLPYATDALAPAIDQQTMELHHGKHHNSYVTTLNTAIEEGDAPADVDLEQLVATAGEQTDRVRNNAGGHWNHSFFWETMAPADQTGEMSEELSAAITEVFGSEEAFRTAFQEAGTGRFGSGWVWLIVDDQDQLQITSTPNQDNPLMDVAEVRGTPILGNDVWEHAYYLTYNNRRADYLEGWWDVVNWATVSDRYAEAIAQ